MISTVSRTTSTRNIAVCIGSSKVAHDRLQFNISLDDASDHAAAQVSLYIKALIARGGASSIAVYPIFVVSRAFAERNTVSVIKVVVVRPLRLSTVAIAIAIDRGFRYICI